MNFTRRTGTPSCVRYCGIRHDAELLVQKAVDPRDRGSAVERVISVLSRDSVGEAQS